jgi:carboxyl-terminal processing protease
MASMSRWNLAWLLGVTTAALLGISLTFSAPSRAVGLQKKHENLKLIVDVLEEVQQRYVRELDQDKMRELVENMINGGLEKLDPHSAFLGADEYKALNQQSEGKFKGVGIRLGRDPRTGGFLVESPIPGTPAYQAGVLAGDYILKVDGKSIDTWDMKKVVENIQGAEGTEVTLTVLHEGAKQPVDLKMKRAEIKIESVMGDQYKIDLKEWNFWVDPNNRIAYVRITAFTKNTIEELTRVVDALQKAGLRGLVVDLRGNPGGLLTAAVEVSSLFLPDGKEVVTTKKRGGVVEKDYRAHNESGQQPAVSFPMAILINRYSASASEIVAAALQDHARAVIIGERSFGKGSVQNLIPMEANQTALKLTTASYWRPNKKNIHRFPDSKEEDDWGVKPNPGFEVKLTDEERIEYYKWRRDRDIVRRDNEHKPVEGVRKDFQDKVLEKAKEYIRAELAKDGKQGAQAPNAVPATAQAHPATATPMRRETITTEVADRSYRNTVR